MHRDLPCPPFESLTPQPWTLPDGAVLNAVRAGSGTPLVFIHGAMGDWRSWAPQWPEFTARYNCISYSRRFCYPNPNRMPAPHHSAVEEAEDLRQLLDAMGLDRVILVGSSYGGFTALAVAAPQRVRALVSVEAPMMKYAARVPGGSEAAAAFRAGDDELAARLMTGGIQGSKPPTDNDANMRRRMDNMLAMKRLALSSDEFPLLAPEDLAAPPMPVMLLSGANTAPVHRAVFTGVCAAMPQARRLVVAGSGHGVAREQPAVFNRAVLEFLREHGL